MNVKGKGSKAMTIKELAAQLQSQIDTNIDSFMAYYSTLKAINSQIEELESKMSAIALELEPVQSLIYAQHPTLEKIFESLKRVYRKEEND